MVVVSLQIPLQANADKMDIARVIVTIDTTVDTAMAEDRMEVSSPVFSAWIRGRLPTGMHAIRARARLVIKSTCKALKTKKSIKGTAIIRTAI